MECCKGPEPTFVVGVQDLEALQQFFWGLASAHSCAQAGKELGFRADGRECLGRWLHCFGNALHQY